MIGVILIAICALVIAIIACEVVDFGEAIAQPPKSKRRD
jgi:hypothetical protein